MANGSKLIGTLSPPGTLTGSISPDGTLSGNLVYGMRHEVPYTGDYTVIPKARQETVLPTANLLMTDNVKVFEIPFADVVNLSGGKTAIIGGI